MKISISVDTTCANPVKANVGWYIVEYLLLLGAAVCKFFCIRQLKASETLSLNILILRIQRGQFLFPEA